MTHPKKNIFYLYFLQIDERVALATEERESVVRAFDAGAGVDGISLYIQLSKTLYVQIDQYWCI